MRKIGVVTVARSDFSFYRPILKLIKSDKQLKLLVFAGGMHLSPEFGMTINEIEAEGYKIDEKIEMNISSDSVEGVAKSIGLGVIGFAQAYTKNSPDILLLLGDRYEMFAAAAAAVPFQIPLAHIHGGEITTGAIDNIFRHTITKMSHLHFTATHQYTNRIIQMGEEPWRVITSGSPSLDNLLDIKLKDKSFLEKKYSITLNPFYFLITFHPATLELEHTDEYTSFLLDALQPFENPLIFTKANADPTGRLINRKLGQFCANKENAYLIDSFGTDDYYSIMSNAKVMIGNSSSGIIEAPSLRIPVVNIGNRQKDRVKAYNIIDVGNSTWEIIRGINTALSDTFINSISDMTNPYHSKGSASEKIIKCIKEIKLDKYLIEKNFNDFSG